MQEEPVQWRVPTEPSVLPIRFHKTRRHTGWAEMTKQPLDVPTCTSKNLCVAMRDSAARCDAKRGAAITETETRA